VRAHVFFNALETTAMKLTIKTTKPRNPYVAASLRRVAGAHRSTASAQRQQAQRALRREMADPGDRTRPSP
jgi:hypothetical protein